MRLWWDLDADGECNQLVVYLRLEKGMMSLPARPSAAMDSG